MPKEIEHCVCMNARSKMSCVLKHSCTYLGGLLYIQTVSPKSVSAVLMLEACYIHEPLHPLTKLVLQDL